MGSDQSTPNSSRDSSFSDNLKERVAQPRHNPNHFRKLPFNAEWSITNPNSEAPIPRSRCFFVHDKEDESAIIGYGVAELGKEFNDIWKIDFQTLTWTRMPIDTSSVSPRQGSTAVMINHLIYVFGGKSGQEYLSDLHIIDLQKMQIIRPPKCESPEPTPRMGHAMGQNDSNIVIWGGNNHTLLDDLWIYSVSSNQWIQVDSQVTGRTDTAFASDESSLYIACSSKLDDMIRFDWSQKTIDEITVTGNMPPFELKGSMFVTVGQFIFLVGGFLDGVKYCIIRGYDTIRKWWFVFHVIPDENTVSIADGSIDNNGIFMVPRTSYGGVVYREKTRQIITILGRPIIEPPPLFVLNIGEPLAYLHLQSDMLTNLSLGNETK
jgi:hypothetical protein